MKQRSFYYLNQKVNVFSVAALAIERYSCMRENQVLAVDKQKNRVFATFIGCLWLFSVSFALVKTLSIKQVYHQEAGTYVCGSSFNKNQEQVYTILQWILTFVLPYTIIIIFSWLLFKFVKNWSENSMKLLSSIKRRNSIEMDNLVDVKL